ncbi:hypothetical protein DRP04_03975 [Archaeoglobales archaeon]|nr:MAG: hypothetical protein DRP04_03975 [Archaeoglobales archaeon]
MRLSEDTRRKLIHALIAVPLSYALIACSIYLLCLFLNAPTELVYGFLKFITVVYLLLLIFIVPAIVAIVYIMTGESTIWKKLLHTVILISAMIFLALSCIIPLMLLLQGVNAEIVLEVLTENMKRTADILLMFVPVILILLYPFSRYIGTEQHVPIPNLLFLSLMLSIISIPVFLSLQYIARGEFISGILMLIPFPLIIALLAILPRIRCALLSAEITDDPELLNVIETLKRELRIDRKILTFSAKTVSGHAAVTGFRKTFLIVSDELMRALKSARWLAEAVLAHELVHVRNHDTVLKELSNAAWRAFIIGAVILLLLKKGAAILFIPIFLVLYFLDRWIEVSRELHADMLVSRSGRNIERALKILGIPAGKFSARRIQLKRIEALENPLKVFVPGFFEGALFAILLVFMFSASGIYTVLEISEFLSGTWNPVKYIVPMISGALVAYMALIYVQLYEGKGKKIRLSALKDFFYGIIAGIALMIAVFALTFLFSLFL